MSRQPEAASRRPGTAGDDADRLVRDLVIGAVVVLDIIAVVAIAMLVIDPLRISDPIVLALIVAASVAMATLFGLLVRSHVRRRRETGLAPGRLAMWWDDVAGVWAVRLLPLLGAIVLVALTTSHGLLPAAAYLAAMLAALIAFLTIDTRDRQSRAAIRRHGATTIVVTWLLAAAALATATGAGLAIMVAAGAVTALVVGKVRTPACGEPDEQPR